MKVFILSVDKNFPHVSIYTFYDKKFPHDLF